MAGRRPKPTRLKLLAGNPGKRKLNDAEPTPTPGRPSVPRGMTKRARREWKRVCDHLEQMGLLASADRDNIASYCSAVGEFLEAEEILERDGLIVASLQGMQAHPAVSMRRNARDQIRKLSSLFGFDPSSRSRIRVPKAKMSDEEKTAKRFFGS